MIRIIHIITGLGSGGAENMLYKLLKYSDKNLYYHEVISLMDEGVMGEKIKAEGIKIHSLNLCGKTIFKSLLKARNICKDFDIVNTWLYHADIFGFIVGKIILKKKLIWNIRHSNLDENENKNRTLKIIKINSLLSKQVDCITYNSNKAFETHKEAGYLNENSVIIPNGFEINKFKFDQSQRRKIRKGFSISEEEKVLITVGRWDIQKDYYTLLKALNELKKQNVNFKMMMVGTNLDSSNRELEELVTKYNLKEDLFMLGRRTDIPELLSAADVYVSTSLGESFSNAIGEAMACELACIVTDVGDSRLIVGETGVTVQAKDYISIASEIMNYLKLSKIARKSEARKRVIDHFEIQSVVKKVEEYIFNLLDYKFTSA